MVLLGETGTATSGGQRLRLLPDCDVFGFTDSCNFYLLYLVFRGKKQYELLQDHIISYQFLSFDCIIVIFQLHLESVEAPELVGCRT